MESAAKKAKDGALRMKDTLLESLGRGVDTVSGKAVLGQVARFAQETDAVNVAIVTRIYNILDRQAALEDQFQKTAARQTWILRLAISGVFLSVLCFVSIIYLFIAKAK